MSHNWRNVLVPPTASINEAIRIIDTEALRIALVVDERRRLLGVVTDGDVRRALLKHTPLDSAVSEIMNAHPRTGDIEDNRTKLLAQMQREGLLHIPIVDNNILVGLETLQDLLMGRRYENPVFLMAGGFGTRLRPLTDNCPKPLLNVGGKPILETILESFIDAGFQSFYISTHYMPEKIQKHFGTGTNWGVEIHYIHETTPLGTAGALGLLPEDLPDLPVIVMNGDLLTKVDFELLLKYHIEHDAAATMCVREYEHQIPYGVISADRHRIKSMVEKPTQKYFVNAGVYVLSKKVINGIAKYQRIDMPDLLQRHIKNNDDVVLFPLHEYWLDIGKMHDFQQAQKDFLTDFI